MKVRTRAGSMRAGRHRYSRANCCIRATRAVRVGRLARLAGSSEPGGVFACGRTIRRIMRSSALWPSLRDLDIHVVTSIIAREHIQQHGLRGGDVDLPIPGAAFAGRLHRLIVRQRRAASAGTCRCQGAAMLAQPKTAPAVKPAYPG